MGWVTTTNSRGTVITLFRGVCLSWRLVIILFLSRQRASLWAYSWFIVPVINHREKITNRSNGMFETVSQIFGSHLRAIHSPKWLTSQNKKRKMKLRAWKIWQHLKSGVNCFDLRVSHIILAVLNKMLHEPNGKNYCSVSQLVLVYRFSISDWVKMRL